MRKNLSSSGIAILVLAAGIIFLSGMVETPARAATIPEVLHSFTGGTTDGAGPYGSLVLSGGNLYGMSVGGGANGVGAIFALDIATGKISLLHSFAGTTSDGGNPFGSLLLSGETLYGMTSVGGTYNEGTIFEYNIKTKQYLVRHSFQSATGDGSNPLGDLILSGKTLYGMTIAGGSVGLGIIFEYNITTGQYKILHSFQGGAADGAAPQRGSLTLSKSILYGMTAGGGSNDDGVIFEFNTATSQMTVLYSFWGGDGASPFGSLVLSGTNLYGMAIGGGEYGGGLIFMLGINNREFTILHMFEADPTDGAAPFGSLVLSGGNLYGMTSAGGSDSLGTIFDLNAATGAYSVLHSFTGTTGAPVDGEHPNGSLNVSGKTIYGMTLAGGANTDGVIFSYSLQ